MHTLIVTLGILLVLGMIVLGGIGGMAIALLIAVIVAGVGVTTFVARHRSRTRV